jgi:hypothetical protein
MIRAPGSGDGKISAVAVEISDRNRVDEPRFRVELTEVVLTKVGTPADHLIIQTWHPGRGLEQRERR